MLENVLAKITDMNLDNLLIAVDSTSLLDIINKLGFKGVVTDLDLKLAFDLDLSQAVDYLTIDARYFRKSEAERTKNGE